MAYFKLKIFQLNTEETPSFLYPYMLKTAGQKNPAIVL
jgi:hypothetical protein